MFATDGMMKPPVINQLVGMPTGAESVVIPIGQ